ncbi:rRNA pseudouridine synthase [Lysobacter capsici]|uniref:rRNA pseudouridine synthase n=1 Tax=Lysobacter capsici TaxID=435897 RepID=UPI00287B7F92|nr:rRNA pseudouridine synthase [Lysobacter capsici]WND82684.1 rRNA pseudouridine synthase [Lysobacter capsici]WND87881.1 rRNA pseudouridine synthase [Lysobacter capsici]
MSEPARLDKCLAELIGCSRAQAQQYIEGGWVRVDGKVVEEPQAPIVAQRVELAPDARAEPAEPATMLLHKPAGMPLNDSARLVVPVNHTQGDVSEVRLLKRHFQHLAPLMALDADASGLVVLTQDPRVRRRLNEDYAQLEQEFVVEISGQLAPYGLKKLAHGLSYRGRPLPPCKVSWQNETRLRFAVKNVQPGQLRHVCAEVGLEVISTRRLRIGRIALSKMPVGEWRYLPVGERF